MISPAATTVGAQNASMPVAPQVSEKALVESARDQAMADIGTATTVDDAITAANATVQLGGRAVQLDSDKMLARCAAEQPGLRDALAPVDAMQQPAGAEKRRWQVRPPNRLAGSQPLRLLHQPTTALATPWRPVAWCGRVAVAMAMPRPRMQTAH